MYLVSSFATIFILLNTTFARPGLWDIHIEKGPAPSPEEGPPLSAGALRDPSKLRYEIIGIGGAAVGWILLTLILLFTVGRRLRRRAQTSARTLGVQMLRTAAPMEVQPGPLSPGKMASLKSWVSGGKHSYKQSNVSVSTVDEKLVESDRQKNLDEMSRLYAAVLAHDEEKSQKARSSGQTSPQSPNFSHPRPNAIARLPSPPTSPQYPPEFQHLRNGSAQSDALSRHPMAPTDPAHSTSTSRASTKVRASPLALANSNLHDRSGSSYSARSRQGHTSVRGMPISEPVAMADLTQSAQYAQVHSPLSPRLYDPGPPPPTPGKYAAVHTAEMDRQRQTPADVSVTGFSMNSSHTTLPLRQYQEAMRSAPATKTTFLERQPDLGRHPKTGVPLSPYSPYTPFTPMTPITPSRLVTKEERKKQKKKEGLKVVSEDDVVMSDEDMWGM